MKQRIETEATAQAINMRHQLYIVEYRSKDGLQSFYEYSVPTRETHS